MSFLVHSRLRALHVALAGTALLLGLLAGFNPLYAVVALLAVGFAVLVLSNMLAGLCLFTVVTFIDTVPNPLGTLSVVKLIGLLIAMSWMATVASGQSTRSFATRLPVMTGVCLALLVWMALSALWSESLAAWINAAQSWTLNMALFPIMFMALRRPRDLTWIYVSFVVGALLSVIYGLATGSATDVGSRLGGAGLNPNIIGDLSTVAAILAATLALQRDWPPAARAGMLVASAFAVVTVFLTGSREAVLGLGVALILSPLLAGRGRRGVVVLGSAAAAAAAIILFLAFTPASVRSRLFAADPTGSGRTNIWLVGLRMVSAHPVEGIGAGNFPVTTIHYLFQPGELQFSQYIVDQPKVAHNIYLEVLAELGVVGLVLFLALLGFCLGCGYRAARLFAARGDPSAELLARGLLLALAGLLFADFFGSELLNKGLWLLLACTPALLAVAETGARRAKRPPRLSWRAAPAAGPWGEG